MLSDHRSELGTARWVCIIASNIVPPQTLTCIAHTSVKTTINLLEHWSFSTQTLFWIITETQSEAKFQSEVYRHYYILHRFGRTTRGNFWLFSVKYFSMWRSENLFIITFVGPSSYYGKLLMLVSIGTVHHPTVNLQYKDVSLSENTLSNNNRSPFTRHNLRLFRILTRYDLLQLWSVI